MEACSKHPKMTVQHGVSLMDLLGKIAMHDPLYAKAALAPFVVIMKRFHGDRQVIEYVHFLIILSLCLPCSLN